MSFWLNHRLAGLDPLPFHAANVLVHGVNVVLLGLVALQCLALLVDAPAAVPRRLVALVAAAFFAMHPM